MAVGTIRRSYDLDQDARMDHLSNAGPITAGHPASHVTRAVTRRRWAVHRRYLRGRP